MRVLVVENDATLGAELAEELCAAGYAVDVLADGIDAEVAAESEPYDLVILDLGLPGRSGLDVLRNWRTHGVLVPVIVLTARDAWHEKVQGFKAGADDYLAKPFHMAELLARVQAVIRRRYADGRAVLQVGDLRLDEEHQTVTRADEDAVELTATEFRLLRYFMLHPGQPLSKARLGDHVYTEGDEAVSNVIEVYVNRLRRKLGSDVIRTRRGQGYEFVSVPADPVDESRRE